jgi:hypothetical protein
MSSYLDSIPPAVATIIASISDRLGGSKSSEGDADKAAMIKRVVDLTDQLTRAFVKALEDAAVEDEDDEQHFGR